MSENILDIPTPPPIAVIDYGHGNLGSILNMLKKIGSPAKLISDPKELSDTRKMILPGVGAFDSGMAALEDRGFATAIRERIRLGADLLGICLGMQMLGESSEEGSRSGLGLVQGRCRRFPAFGDKRLKIPHMGWTSVEVNPGSPLFENMHAPPRFYFVHSYYMECDRPNNVAAKASYGLPYAAAVQADNIYGVQFHPEKSHQFGMTLLRNFSGLNR